MKNRLAKVWDKQYPIDQSFRWKRENGDWVRVQDMNLFHVFHALMLTWNHGIPEDYMMPPYKIITRAISRKDRRFILSNLMHEMLNRRHQLTSDMWTKLYQIMEWIGSVPKKEVPKQLW